VRDTGTGIPEAILERIFDPFFSTKDVGAGTGLGLATVYGIIKQTGGFITVDSRLGEGTTFHIYLPRHDRQPDDSIPEKPREQTGDLTGSGTILLVEDEDPVRLFGARALRNKGYEVVEARTGEAAVDIFRQDPQRFDLMITDVMMPVLDGPTLIRIVREIRPELRVVCISGYAEESMRQKLDSQTNIAFLPKPFTLKQLAGTVKKVMENT
jgi:two-component system cell cycle sensor histidine kinase/response regulator CckA